MEEIRELKIGKRNLIFHYFSGDKELFDNFYTIIKHFGKKISPIMDELKISKNVVMGFFLGAKENFLGSFSGNIEKNTLMISFDLTKLHPYKEQKKVLIIYILDLFLHELTHNITLDEEETQRTAKKYVRSLIKEVKDY